MSAYIHYIHGPKPHTNPVYVYWLVFAALLFLTFITVFLARYDFGWLSLTITLLIASIKAGLVLMVFMHLWYDNKFYFLVISVSIVFLGIFLLLSLSDVATRNLVDMERANFLPRDEKVYQYMRTNSAALPLRPGLQEPKMELLHTDKPGEHD